MLLSSVAVQYLVWPSYFADQLDEQPLILEEPAMNRRTVLVVFASVLVGPTLCTAGQQPGPPVPPPTADAARGTVRVEVEEPAL